MRRYSNLSLTLVSCLMFFLVVNTSCGKGGDPAPTPTPTPVEVDLAVTTTPTVNSNQAPAALGTGLPVAVTITSTVPTGGVKIDVTAKLETGSSNFFTGGTASTTTAANNYNITNIPAGGAACVCSITVTSIAKPTNVWTGTFRFANK